MALVAAKCTNCGANLEVDNSKDAGICQHCGTAFITEKVINNYYSVTNISANTVNITDGNIENFFILAKNAKQSGNNEEAILYFNKILQINPNHYEALYGKAICAFFSSTLLNIKTEELIVYTKKALVAFEGSNSTKKIDFAIEILHDFNCAVESWVNAFQNHYFKYKNLKSSASEIIDNYNAALCFVLNIDQIVSENFIDIKDISFINPWIKLKEWGVDCCRGLFEKYTYDEYGDHGSFALQDPGRTEVFNTYQTLIYAIKQLNSSYIEKNPLINKSVSGGCYIATAIYGSYDCPEVWVLRRYRDNVLAKNLLGKFFIKTYYFLSPKLIKTFGKLTCFQKFWRKKLDKIVIKLKEQGFEDTNYFD